MQLGLCWLQWNLSRIRMQSLPLMLRRKHFFSFEQFYVTGTGRVGSEVTMCYDYSFSILNVLQREVKKNVLTNLQYLKEFCSFQARCQDLFYLKKNFLSEELNMLSLKSSRKKKKKELWGKPRKVQKMSSAIQPFSGSQQLAIPWPGASQN